MKKINLTQGKKALVDDVDYERIKTLKWHAIKCRSNWYAAHSVSSKTSHFKMEKFILPTIQGMVIDHINGNGLDNRRSNLRYCSQRENLCNQRRPRNNTSGFKGVSGSSNKWMARICVNGKRIFLGEYKTKRLAHKAYSDASKKYHGEYGRNR